MISGFLTPGGPLFMDTFLKFIYGKMDQYTKVLQSIMDTFLGNNMCYKSDDHFLKLIESLCTVFPKISGTSCFIKFCEDGQRKMMNIG